MAEDISEETMTGLLLPHPGGVTIWEAESSYTEQSPRPGVAEGDSEMELIPAGETQEVPELQVQCTVPGLSNRGRFVVSADGGTTWMGWDAPYVISDFENLAWPAGGVLDEVYAPHVCRLPDGGLASVEARVALSLGSWWHQLVVRVWDPSTATWGAIVVVETVEDLGSGGSPTAISYPLHPTIAVDNKTGALMVARWTDSVSSGAVPDSWQVKTWISKDTGSTWRRVSTSALPAALDMGNVNTLRRLRWAHNRGQLLLLVAYERNLGSPSVESWSDALEQYSSTDLGASFRQVWTNDSTAEANTGHRPEVVALPDGTFLVGAVIRNAIAGGIAVALWRLGSAAQVLPTGRVEDAVPQLAPPSYVAGRSSSSGSPAIHVMDDHGGLALVCMEDGELFCYTQHLSSTTQITAMLCAKSLDLGSSWDIVGVGGSLAGDTSGIGDWSDDLSFMSGWTAAAAAGRVAMLTGWEASTSSGAEGALSCVWLGGYSTIEMPNPFGATDPVRLAGWEYSGLPMELPENQGLYTAAGTGSASLSANGVDVVGDYVYSRSTAAPRVHFERQVAYGSDAGGEIGVEILLSPPLLARRELKVRVTSTGYTVEDAAAATLATVAADSAGGLVLRFSVDASTGAALVEHRELGGSARSFQAGWSGTLSSPGTGTGVGTINWGHLASTLGGEPTSTWAMWHESETVLAGADEGIAGQSTEDMLGRRYAELGSDVPGLQLRALDGPALPGDIHTIEALPDWRLWRATEARSPRHTWRSSADGVAESVAYAISGELLGVADTDLGSDLAALWLKSNIRNLELSRYTGSAWVSLGTLDLAASAGTDSLPFTRHGAAVVPSADVADVNRYYGDLVGWTAVLPGGVMRRVGASTEGSWVTANGRGLVLHLEDIDGTEPASGDLDLVPPEVVVLINLAGAKVAGWKLDISAQSTVDGYYEATMMWGVVKVTRCMDWGWGTTHEPQTEQAWTEDRLHRVRQLAPLERVWEWGWDQGRVTTWFQQADYLLASNLSGAVPVATRDVPQLLRGIWEEVGGGLKAVVALRSIPQATSTLTVLTRREQWLYGVTQGDLVTDSVIAEGSTATDGKREIIRVPRISVRELR